MNCFPCFNKEEDSENSVSKKEQSAHDNATLEAKLRSFNFRELAMATKNFRQESLLGEGGFGRVFKGTLQATEEYPEQVVAVKQLDRCGTQEPQEFTAEVMKLSHLNHTNLVNLIGYCADGDQRALVYEYVPMGSLEQHLLGEGTYNQTLDWGNRMKIASGSANALEYLHEKANPPVVYGDFKPSNVLLNEEFEPKLSDVGLSKFGAGDGATQQSSRMMGTYGYSAPEYSKDGEVTLKSDIYSFGVVLLELITGRRAVDTSRPTDEQNLVTWAQPYFRDPKRYAEMADPRLNKQFPATSINQAVGIAAMCIQEEPMVRPLISDVTSVLGCICMIPNVPQPQAMEYENEAPQSAPAEQVKDSAESHSSSSRSSSDSEGTESVANDQQSGEHDSEEESSEHSEEESGSESENVGESDEESTESGNRAETTRVKSRQKSSRKAKTKQVSSGNTEGDNSSRPSVVTFKEPTKGTKNRTGEKSKAKEGSSSSSEDSSSESDTEGGSTHDQENDSRGHSDATENGLTSSQEDGDSESDESPERPKRKGN